MANLGRSRRIASYFQKQLSLREPLGNLLCNMQAARRFSINGQARRSKESDANEEQAPGEETETQKLLAEKDKVIAEKEKTAADFKVF